jgi:folate-binding Fe-S cluster repair protein YgfZ
MKKVLYAAMVLTILTFFAGGCAKKAPEPLEHSCLEGAPSWVIDPSMEGGLSGLGSAKIGKAGIQFARTEAISVARDEIARTMEVKVKNMFKNFTQVTGVGDDETVDRVAVNVSKQVANQTLSGSMAKEAWISPCNEYYTLVVLDPASVQAAVKENVLSSLKNEKALWQQFQAKKAHDELEEEIEKEFGDYR